MRFPGCAPATSLVLTLLSSPAGAVAEAQRAPPTVRLRPGMIITESVRIERRTYWFPAFPSTDSALVIIRGDGITVDFNGATLQGILPEADPDGARGVAIRIEGGRNVRVRNAVVRGYRIAILARGTRDLELSGNVLSYNWKPRLFSLVEHESLADWLSFHQNEKDEWLRFGAAMYLSEVRGGTIRGNRAEQGMNGLLLVKSDSLLVRDNTFSFNSGLGIGLYRSSDNTIVRNRVEYNVRGYSHGFYRRGQDSANLLLYEQSSRNVVAFNNATHGGDGLFLWAGQSTMDTGQGGANDNLFFGNDFSFAPTNAMEATFSRNAFVANRAEGSEYGLWGGYSWESRIVANCFADNRWGIAIEHGQDNVIVANRFLRDSTAIRLWADSIQPSDWGYPKHRDTRSRDYRIQGNRFSGNRTRLDAANTSALYASDNDSSGTGTGGCVPMPVVPAEFAELVPALTGIPRSLPATPDARRPRAAIVVDEWGPFDWRSPRLWPVDSTRAMPLRLAVLGPTGMWRVAERRGVSGIVPLRGRVGDTLTVTPHPDSAGDWSVTLEYRGVATRSPRGALTPAGQPVRFSYGRFEPAMDWALRFFTWSDSTDPRTHHDAFQARLRGTPILMRRAPRLDFMWFRPTIRELPQSRFALEATTTVTLDPGTYTLRTLSDDGIRVWVDGRLVIDNWDLHGTEVDHAPLTGGRHELRVQFFQIDGWTELRLDILRGRVRSAGSPGPH
ncbi:MAG TPA: NosD domain-containing protein [Gemmatimonadaceae bacterium]|nr:NosD domain-containing protein [Gemmatimonadaceae bacterium]